MKRIDRIYSNGAFQKPHGQEQFDLINPSDQTLIGQVILGDVTDTREAIAAAKAAFATFSKTTVPERMDYLQRLHDAVLKRVDDLTEATMLEYGAPRDRAYGSNLMAAESFLNYKKVLEDFDFSRTVGTSQVIMEPLGVVGIITPWNANAAFICNKLATAIAAGCTAVIKPSELSALQTQIVIECLHEARLPAGVFSIINGRGDVVGAELTRHPDIAKISFTGSTAVGKAIARGAVDNLKRVTLELGGKSPNILLDDADLTKAIPMAVAACFMNSGQACIAGSRLLVPEAQLETVKELVKKAIAAVQTGPPSLEGISVGPLATVRQYDRVQEYIQLGIDEGAEVLIGGTGHPEGLEAGNFVKPTAFVNVTNTMRIAREEIFGPVLCIITYKTEAEAIAIANDTDYGLQAYVSSENSERAHRVAGQLVAGRVLINCLNHDPMAPFGGFKQSGLGREYGVFGLEEYLEPKTIIV